MDLSSISLDSCATRLLAHTLILQCHFVNFAVPSGFRQKRREMIAERMGNERANSKTIARWSAYLDELHSRIARHFFRPEVRARAYRYLGGLLKDVRRKNSWQMAETIGEKRPRGVQHLLNDARWDCLKARCAGSSTSALVSALSCLPKRLRRGSKRCMRLVAMPGGSGRPQRQGE